VELSRHIGIAYEGRFYLEQLPRSAKILGATMDILLIDEAVRPFYFGKIQMRAYNTRGKVEIQELALWWFDYHKSDNRVTARLIPPTSVTGTQPDGEQVGTISFEVPGGRTGIANGGRELEHLKNVEITLSGHGSFKAAFERGGEPTEVITRIPPAKLLGS
jgi:hypothetical protein